VAFGVSAVLHVVALLLYSSIDVRFGQFRPGDEVAAGAEVEGIEVINLEEVAAESAERPDEPRERATPVPVRPRLADVPSGDEALVPGAPAPPSPRGRTAAQRLQPGTNDGRLWPGFEDDIVALTPEQRMQNLLAAEILDLMDAMEVAAAREEAALDWTYTDEDGQRWGISPGVLHLGKLKLPLPSFGTPAGESRDLMRRYMQDAEIRRAAGQLLIDETLEERARAIRARRDAERNRDRTGQDSSVVRRRSGGGGPGGGGVPERHP
jgi:hypothetical protein